MVQRGLAVLAVCMPCLATAAPFTPGSDAEIVERLPAAGDPLLRRVESLRKQLAARPDDAALRLDIGRRYFQLAMAQGDPRYVGYAAATIAPLAATASDNSAYWLLHGQIRQYGHDFTGALESLERASELDPQAAEPIAWRAAIHMVQAQYGQALSECTKLVPLAHPLHAHGCAAYVQASTGNLAPAYDALKRALAGAGDVPAELALWIRTRLAEMAIRLGRNDEADHHFSEALKLGVVDQFLLGAYADFLLEQRRAGEVLNLLAGWERSDILLLRLALAGRTANDPRAAAWAGQLRERFAAAARRGDRLHEQEAARFELDVEGRPAAALALAARNYQLQKEPRDAQVLMRAALASGRPQAAKPALEWLQSSGYEDPALAALAQQLSSREAGR